MEDIIDFDNDIIKIDYSNLYYGEFKRDILNIIFKDLKLDKYKLYEETNWYKFLDKVINGNEYEFDDKHINYFLGVMYFNGCYVDCDYKKAFEYFTKVSKKNAFNELDYMYRIGEYITYKYEKSFEYYKIVSEKGNIEALIKIGYMYYHGYGVEENNKKAYECYKIASDKGYTIAMEYLGNMYYYDRSAYIEENYIEQNYEKAFEYYKLASDKGSLYGLEKLCKMYRYGFGIKKNYKTAIKLYKQLYKKNWYHILVDIGKTYEENDKLLKSIKYYNLCDIPISEKIQYFKELFIKLSKSELRNKVNIKLYESMCINIKQLFIKKVAKQINKHNTTIIYYEAIKGGLHKYNEKNKTLLISVSTKQKELLKKLKGKNKRLSKYISLLIFDFIY